MKWSLIPFSVLLFALIGCQKEIEIELDDVNPPPATDSLLIREEVKSDDGDSTIFSLDYDAEDRIKKITLENFDYGTSTKSVEYWYEFERDGQGIITRIRAGYPQQLPVDTVYIMDFVYQNGKYLYSYSADEDGNAESDTIKYTYDASGWLASRSSDGLIDGYTFEENFITHPNGNILSRKLFVDQGSGLELSSESEFEYDDKITSGEFVINDIVPLIEIGFLDNFCSPNSLIASVDTDNTMPSTTEFNANITYGSDNRPRIADWSVVEGPQFPGTTSGTSRYFYRAK